MNARCTGARQVATGLAELERRQGRVCNHLSMNPFVNLTDVSIIGPCYIHVHRHRYGCCWHIRSRIVITLIRLLVGMRLTGCTHTSSPLSQLSLLLGVCTQYG